MSEIKVGITERGVNYIDDTCSTGLISGGVISLTGGIGFQISSGTGYIRNPSNVLIKISWGTITSSTTLDGVNFICIDNTGSLFISSDNDSSNINIQLGAIFTAASNTVVVGFSSLANSYISDYNNRIASFIKDSIGATIIHGGSISEKANPDFLQINMSEVMANFNLENFTIPTTDQFLKVIYSSDLGVSLETGTIANEVTIGYYNDATQVAASALIPMTSGYWKKDMFFITAEGQLYYVYSQKEFATELEALAGEFPPLPASVSGGLVTLFGIVTQDTSTTIANGLVDIRPLFSRIFVSRNTVTPTTVIDHGDLTGLADDDHLQYFNQVRGDARYIRLLTGNILYNFYSASSFDISTDNGVYGTTWMDFNVAGIQLGYASNTLLSIDNSGIILSSSSGSPISVTTNGDITVSTNTFFGITAGGSQAKIDTTLLGSTQSFQLPALGGIIALFSDIPTNISAFTNDSGYITASSSNNLTNKTGNISQWTNDSGYLTSIAGAVTSVSGTSNRITSTGGSTPVIDISGSYVGQSSITTLGTITTGVWNGTAITYSNLSLTGGIVNTDISNSAAIAYSKLNLSGSVTNSDLAGGITNAKLVNSTISGIALGSNLATLTIGTGLSGSSYNGSAGVSITIDSTVVTLTGTQTLTNKTITSGKYNTILDTNGNEILRFNAVTSSVNWIDLYNAGTLANPKIVANGSDTNINLQLESKGTGTINFQVGTAYLMSLPTTAPTSGQVLTYNGSIYLWSTPPQGTVTTVSVTTANGVSGSVANASTTPAITLTLGAITPTTVNGLTINTTTGTLAITNGKSLSISNTLILSGTDGSSVAFGTGGTVTYTSNNLSVFAATTSAQLAGVISDETGSGLLVFGTSPTLSTSLITDTATFALVNTTATTVNFAGVGTTINIGATTGTLTLNNATIVGGNATQALFNTVATTMNFGGVATTWTVGAASGTFTLRNTTVALSGGTVTGAATQNVFNTTSTTVNAFGAATTITMANTTAAATFSLFSGATLNATTKTINIGTTGVSGSTTNINLGSAVSGALGTLTLGFPTIVSANATLTLFDSTTTTLTAFSAVTTGTLFNSTGAITLNIGAGATTNATTKTINLGTTGVSGSITALNIGSAVSGATNNIKMNVTPASDATGDIWYRNSSGFVTRLAVGTNGQVLTLASGLPSWATAAASSIFRTYQFTTAGIISATTQGLSQATDSAIATSSPSGALTTSSGNPGINNGGVNPYTIVNACTITKIRVKIAGAAVGGAGPVTTPLLRLRIYRVDYSTRTQLGSDVDITLSATGIGVSNDSSGNGFQTAVSSVLSIAVAAGDLIGMEFVNVGATNSNINVVRGLYVVMETTE